jgi:alginate O-acetyltransferase complex protein AlgI
MWYFLANFLVFLLPAIFIFDKIPTRYRWQYLLVLSLLFYASFDLTFLCVLVVLTLLNYFLSRFIVTNKIIFYTAVGINLLSLCLFKFSSSLLYPIGMSYYVFQSIGFLVDTRAKKMERESSFFHFLLYNLFFPRVLSGPIEKHGRFVDQLNNLQTDSNLITSGFTIFLYGVLKKTILSERIFKIYDYSILEKNKFELSTYLVFFFLSSFAVYIDFSAYSDMAYGLAKIFGIDLTHNFNSPYSSYKFSGLWKRWHVSLYLWIKEYVFEKLRFLNWPLINSRSILIMMCFLLSGIWHSNFGGVLWGLFCGIFVILDRLWDKKLSRLPYIARIGINFILISFASQLYFLKNSVQLINIVNHFSFGFSQLSLMGLLKQTGVQSLELGLVIATIPMVVLIDHYFSKDRGFVSRLNMKVRILLMTAFLLLWYSMGYSLGRPFMYSGV